MGTLLDLRARRRPRGTSLHSAAGTLVLASVLCAGLALTIGKSNAALSEPDLGPLPSSFPLWDLVQGRAR
jgi:hypothetical protein